ncbi:MAG: DciA family protein [Aliishimia sp.]
MSTPKASYVRRSRGFKRADSLLQSRIRDASATRGFAQSRLLTHWSEVAGTEIASISRPVEVSYGRQGMGATLVLLTTGANAPVLEMEKEKLRARVNSVYGYSAISRIRITQTAPIGFADGQVAFGQAPKDEHPSEPAPEVRREAARKVAPIQDDGLRTALENLAANIISKNS